MCVRNREEEKGDMFTKGPKARGRRSEAGEASMPLTHFFCSRSATSTAAAAVRATVWLASLREYTCIDTVFEWDLLAEEYFAWSLYSFPNGMRRARTASRRSRVEIGHCLERKVAWRSRSQSLVVRSAGVISWIEVRSRRTQQILLSDYSEYIYTYMVHVFHCLNCFKCLLYKWVTITNKLVFSRQINAAAQYRVRPFLKNCYSTIWAIAVYSTR